MKIETKSVYAFNPIDNPNFARLGIRWGGIAGDGLQSMGVLFAKYFNKLGYYIIGHPGTQSTIRGGHIWYHLEVCVRKFKFFDRQTDILVGFNEQSLETHLSDVKEYGIIILNSDTTKLNKELDQLVQKKKITVFNLQMSTYTREIDLKLPILKNTVVIGFLIRLLGLKLTEYKNLFSNTYAGREKIIDVNFRALDKGYAILDTLFPELSAPVLSPGKLQRGHNLIISGNEAIALGAIASDLKFLAQYPITPASSILKFISNHADKLKIVVKLIEDEIAAIISITAASWTGVRAMTATSGPGFSLMAEGLGYAGMTETPIVIVLSQRAGPSTGVPTKIEQADLFPVLFSSHGEFPRCIIAPRNVEECFQATVKAFNMADKYSLPVILMTDFALSEMISTTPPFDFNVQIERGKIWNSPTQEDPEFKRFKITENGVSPRAIPGTQGATHVLVGAEHDEYSNSLSGNRCGLPLSGELRTKMTEKRFRKLKALEEDMDPPRWYGPEDSDFTLICWGSLENACRETIEKMNNFDDDRKWNVLSFRDIYPFPTSKVVPLLKKIKKGIIIECSYTGQFEKLIFLNTAWRPIDSIRFTSGETPTSYEIGKGLISKYKILNNTDSPKNINFFKEAWN